MLLCVAPLCANTARAQAPEPCSLGHVTEHAAPMIPVQLNGRVVEGVVQVLATFDPGGKVSSSKVISGPGPLRFQAEAYIRGWLAEPGDGQRQCTVQLDFRFDGSQGACGPHNETHIRAERLDDTHVRMHLSCDIW